MTRSDAGPSDATPQPQTAAAGARDGEPSDAAALARLADGARLARPVALVGLMGAGKTTVGRRLAAALGAEFVDSDEEIEAAARMTVADIFRTMGEESFRQGERRVIARLFKGPPRVIATGGGAFMNDRTRALMRERAVSVWIRAELDTLLERVGRKTTRPLLAGGDPRAILADLIEKRHPIYAEADLVVDSHAGERHEAVVGRIIDALRRRDDALVRGG